jgi:hypothetical protein
MGGAGGIGAGGLDPGRMPRPAGRRLAPPLPGPPDAAALARPPRGARTGPAHRNRATSPASPRPRGMAGLPASDRGIAAAGRIVMEWGRKKVNRETSASC